MKRNGMKPIKPSQIHYDSLCHGVLDEIGIPREQEGKLLSVLGRLVIVRDWAVRGKQEAEKAVPAPPTEAPAPQELSPHEE